MANESAKKLFARKLAEGSSRRYASSRVDWQTFAGERLATIGGRWDRRARRYAGDSPDRALFEVHPGQELAARWFVDWLGNYLAWRRNEGERTTINGDPVRSMLLLAGRRAGKTDLGIRMAISFAVAVPGSRVWLASPAQPEQEELEQNLAEMLPRELIKGKPLGAPWWRWTLVNGSRISLRSAHDPESLKRGRADFVLLNEGQKMAKRAYVNVRGALTDRGGLCVVAANPPDDASGQWVADMQEEAQGGRRPTVCFAWSARENPRVDWSSLEALKSEVDDRTYRQEVLGEIVPRTDIVWSAYRHENVQDEGRVTLGPDGAPWPLGAPGARVAELRDVTTDFLRRHFRRDFACALGLDFQLRPFMAATVRKFYSPYWETTDPNDVLDWTIGELAVDQGDENDLIDALEALGLRGDSTVCVADASGEWQNAERTKGGGSFDMFRRRGWKHIFVPDTQSTKNPGILDSVRASNARLCSADGKRRAFVAPSCLNVLRSLKLYENRLGVPNRRSEFAHFSDAWRYPHWRFWPRRFEAPKGPLKVSIVNTHARNEAAW